MEIVIGWIIFAVVVGIGAAYRGRSALGWTALSVVISPLLALVLLLLLPSLKIAPGTPTPETHVRCPDCRELVLKDARRCKHCGITLVPQA
jgi:hypothetical protein